MVRMERQVVLLRAVNVGARKLSMAALRIALEAAGCRDVVTYIQSGNVVLTPPQSMQVDLTELLERVIAEVAGFDVPVVLRSAVELAGTVDANPYPGTPGNRLHVAFYAAAPDGELVRDIDLARHAPETCTLIGRDLYLLLPNGLGRGTLPAAVDRTLRRADPPSSGTARNWNTVLALLQLASGATDG